MWVENVFCNEFSVECVVCLELVLIRLVMVFVWVKLSLLLRNVCLENLFGWVMCMSGSVRICFNSRFRIIGLLCFCSFSIFLLVKEFGLGNYSVIF